MSYGMNGSKVPQGYSQGRMDNFTPGQHQLFAQMQQQVAPDSYLAKLAGGDQSQFEQMEAPAWRQFNEAQGQNASRFSGMGMGARGGSGFKNFQNQATSNFAQDLQSKRLELQRQAINDMMGFSNQLLGQRPYENYLVKEQPEESGWENIAGQFASAIPSALAGFATGGVPGAAVGAAGSFASNIGKPQTGGNTSGRYGLPTFMGR